MKYLKKNVKKKEEKIVLLDVCLWGFGNWYEICYVHYFFQKVY